MKFIPETSARQHGAVSNVYLVGINMYHVFISFQNEIYHICSDFRRAGVWFAGCFQTLKCTGYFMS